MKKRQNLGEYQKLSMNLEKADKSNLALSLNRYYKCVFFDVFLLILVVLLIVVKLLYNFDTMHWFVLLGFVTVPLVINHLYLIEIKKYLESRKDDVESIKWWKKRK